MNDENTKKLFKRYKFLNKKTLPDGFECGDGWYKLVYDMCKELKSVSPPADFVVTKIAERYGDLEVHTKNGTMQTRVIIDEYNTQSMEICDECGKDKDLQSCDKCTVPEIDYSDPEEETEEDDSNQSSNCSSGSCSSGSCNCP